MVQQIQPFIVAQLEIIVATIFIAVGLLVFTPVSAVGLFMMPTTQSWYWFTFLGLAGFLGSNYYALQNMQLTNVGNNSLLSP